MPSMFPAQKPKKQLNISKEKMIAGLKKLVDEGVVDKDETIIKRFQIQKIMVIFQQNIF